jgi:hypothetical protein
MRNRYRFINLSISLIFIFIFSLFKLPAKTDDHRQNFRGKFYQQKAERYKQLLLSENQITASQEDFNVTYYSLDLLPNTTTEILTGSVEIVAEVVSSSLDQVDLNFWNGMTITDIHLSSAPGEQLTYTHQDEILSVFLDTPLSQGEQFSITIGYNGQPQNSPYFSFDFGTYDNEPMILTVGAPFGARSWWPSKDIPSDKADSVDIKVIVPNDLIVAANGSLAEKLTVGDTTRYLWQVRYPISTYLVSLAIHPYVVYYDQYFYNDNADTMDIHFYMFSSHYDDIFDGNAKTKDMISAFADLFGEYPFVEEKYGHAQIVPNQFLAMEHQTCSSMDFDWYKDDPYNTDLLIAHELSHSWWGNMITNESFHHAWLNEGFATYSEALWLEHLDGTEAANNYMNTEALYLGGGTIYVEDPYSEEIYSLGLTYYKAAWVLHMLRHTVSDPVFFDILKTYGASEDHRFGSINTEEFQTLCEEISGQDLQKFFQQWIYEEFYPLYAYGWSTRQRGVDYDIKLRIDQVQDNTGLYWMPIDIRVTMASGDTNFVVWDSLQSQKFELSLPDEPLIIELDPDNWILKKIDPTPVLPPPYAATIDLNNTYQSPGKDTLIINSLTINPDHENLELTAIIDSADGNIVDMIALFDDGDHDDSTAGDGYYGGYWPVKSGERNYAIEIKTVSLTSDYTNMSLEKENFTTIGPVSIERYEISSADTIPNHGDRLRYNFYLRNDGQQVTASEVTIKVTPLDTCTSVTAFSDPVYGDIMPGNTAEPSRGITVNFQDNCPDSIFVQLKVDIYSGDISYWQETISIFVHREPVGLVTDDDLIPTTFALGQNYPNPFNPVTTIEYSVRAYDHTPLHVNLSIYNLLGQKVATLVSEKKIAGHHQVEWDASGFSSGIYYYKIEAGAFQQVRKMVLLK